MVDWWWPDGWLNDPERSRLDRWFAAAKSGDMEKIVDLIDSGVDINAGDPINITALLHATQFGHHDLMRLLIERGASLEPANTKCYTALTAAIQRARPWSGSGLPPDPVPLQILHEAGVRYRLYDAVLIDDVPLARQRLEAGADPNFAEGSYDGPVLLIAARHGHREMVDLLLDHGADTEGMDDLGNRPLTDAAGRGHIEVVRRLLSGGADLDAVDWHGCSALSWAARGRHREVAAYLIGMGAKRGICDALVMDDRALFLSFLDAQMDDKGRIAGSTQDDRYSLTMLAIAEGNLPIFSLLMERGAKNQPDFAEKPLLAHAARHGQVGIALLLIKQGADVHAAGSDGLTPLAWATHARHHAVADLLREAGATH
ncbi:ankyrin repeat domain-containing protein [Tundrisphaera sp. TA3]|uniref:ankyrin repeat domain-containing protein n=1 Tax=Tundrisphaera sp. TA3 TaxID=3435775 RepID=UPI003EBD01C8